MRKTVIFAALVLASAIRLPAQEDPFVIAGNQSITTGTIVLAAGDAVQYNLIEEIGMTTATFTTMLSAKRMVLGIWCENQESTPIQSLEFVFFDSFQTDPAASLDNSTPAKTGIPVDEGRVAWVEWSKPYIVMRSANGARFRIFRARR